jgi:hypothetical protein
VQAYPAETSEAFCDGHNIGFEFFGGVPRSILYSLPPLESQRLAFISVGRSILR